MLTCPQVSLAVNMTPTSYFKVLQIDPDAEPEVVKAAYRALSRKYHPDGTHPSAERMKQLNNAYAVLSTPESRAAYMDGFYRWGTKPEEADKESAFVAPPMKYQGNSDDPPIRRRKPFRRRRFDYFSQLGGLLVCILI